MKRIISSRGPSLPIISAFLFTIGLIFFLIGCMGGPPNHSRAAQAERGEVLFQNYCQVCHGEKGNGPMAESLVVKPTDLTRLTIKTKTKEFPIEDVVRYIDGTKLLASHGTREMPIWGEVFSDEEKLDTDQIKGKYGELIAYLMSIQVKE